MKKKKNKKKMENYILNALSFVQSAIAGPSVKCATFMVAGGHRQIADPKPTPKLKTIRCRTDNKFPSLLPGRGVGVVIIIIVFLTWLYAHTTSS